MLRRNYFLGCPARLFRPNRSPTSLTSAATGPGVPPEHIANIDPVAICRVLPAFREKAFMRGVLIVGASQKTGLESTRRTPPAGHYVRALARSTAAISISNSGPNPQEGAG